MVYLTVQPLQHVEAVKMTEVEKGSDIPSAETWIKNRVGFTPNTALGWFRAGVGFYNHKKFEPAIECFNKSVKLDPLNVSYSCPS